MNKKICKHVRTGAPATEFFDMTKKPEKQKMYLMPELWAFSKIKRLMRRGKINKINMENIKPPYILLCNHASFYDFFIMTDAVSPNRVVFPAAVGNYMGISHFLDKLGCFPKRRYVSDLSTVKHCIGALADGNIFGIYPEARFCLCGKTEIIPKSVSQLVKGCEVPVVTLTCRGHHIYDPVWGNGKKRRINRMAADMECVLTAEEVKNSSEDKIHEAICSHLYNDDFRWQSENRIRSKYKKRAEGLHRVLYQCPECMTEFKTDSEGDTLFCRECGQKWKLTEYGELEAEKGESRFRFPSDWYDWEREQVRQEVYDGKYHYESDADINDLPNPKGFVHIGKGHIVHSSDGFHVEAVRDYDGEKLALDVPAAEQYSVHVDFDYKFGCHRDFIDINDLDNTWYVFPERKDFSLTKISLATEEIYKKIWNK